MIYMFFNKGMDKKLWYIYTIESAFNSTVKNNKTIKFKGKWMELGKKSACVK